MKKALFIALLLLGALPAYAAPQYTVSRTILPETTNLYELGTSTRVWLNGFFKYASTTALSATSLCLTGDCRTSWPSGIGNVATSSAETATYIPSWTSTAGTPATLSGGSADFTWDNTLSKLTAKYASTTALTVSGNGGALDVSGTGTSTIAGNLRIGGALQVIDRIIAATLYVVDEVFYNGITGPRFTATSTSLASTFPYASTTAISASNAICFGSDCRTSWANANLWATSTVTNGIYAAGATKVGIGTTTPAWTLQIADNKPFLALTDTKGIAGSKHWTVSSQSGRLFFATSSDAYATTTNPSLTLYTIGTGPAVGIGTASPAAKLDVVGAGAGGSSLLLDNNTYLSWRNSSGSIRTIMSQNSGNGIDIKTSDGLYVRFLNSTGAYELARINQTNTASFGVGTTTPGATIAASSSASAIAGMFDSRGTGDILRLLANGVSKVTFGLATTTVASDLAFTNGNNATGVPFRYCETVNYNSATPQLIYTARDGTIIQDVYWESTTGWSGALGANLDLGDASDNDGLMDIPFAALSDATNWYGEDPSERGDYMWDSADSYGKQKAYNTTTAINIYNNSGSSSQGSGQVCMTIMELK